MSEELPKVCNFFFGVLGGGSGDAFLLNRDDTSSGLVLAWFFFVFSEIEQM